MRNFFSGFFQLGYVTRNVSVAIAAFREKFGPIEFLINDPTSIDGKAPPTRRIALAYIDDVMTEIIEPDPAQKTIYDDALPAVEGPIRLHHFGYLIDDHAAMLERLRNMGYAVPLHGSVPGALDYSYADTRADLGVFSEFIRLDEGGRAFFNTLPRTSTR
ncbi:VOC family protein [Sphingobium sp.]|uniref:VOC family protein n=1 Tax=Sphingobium sp. TaxID=1912891 RepID=UPI0028BECD0C|nr:VOC family protein [Sphingobium sp.]